MYSVKSRRIVSRKFADTISGQTTLYMVGANFLASGFLCVFASPWRLCEKYVVRTRFSHAPRTHKHAKKLDASNSLCRMPASSKRRCDRLCALRGGLQTVELTWPGTVFSPAPDPYNAGVARDPPNRRTRSQLRPPEQHPARRPSNRRQPPLLPRSTGQLDTSPDVRTQPIRTGPDHQARVFAF